MPIRVEDDPDDDRVVVITIRAGEDPEWNFGGFTATTRDKPLVAAVMRTDDAVEGPRAFAEKRPPRYRGA